MGRIGIPELLVLSPILLGFVACIVGVVLLLARKSGR
jgi:hypothetical protein